MEVDRRLVVLSVAVSACHQLDRLDLAVDAFRCGVGDTVCEVRHDVGQMALERLGRLDDRP